MVNFTILAGGYTTFIATYSFNTDDNSLTYLNQYTTGPNPSWISASVTNTSILYAVNENTPGALQSFTVGPEGALTGPYDTAYSGGDGPPYCAQLTTGQVGIMNYGSGTGRIIPTLEDQLYFSNDSTTITFPSPPAPNVSLPHMAYQYGSEVFVPDKGNDKIWRLTQNGSAGDWKIQGLIEQPQYSGPRHIRIYQDMLYTVHELASTLTLQAVPSPPNGTTPILADLSMIPPNPPAGSVFAGAEILIPEPTENFPTPYIYTSNRNTGVQDSRGDTIAIFEHVGDGLQLVQQVYTGLDQIRGMMMGPAGAGEEYIVAAGYAGTAGVKMFRRTEGGRNLEQVAVNTELPTRTSFVWYES
ncbi:hypothetical protein SERLA73DRAFT_114730 [Serpula lacrymans var. lacrymans S7.3]|uniref:Isomerase YbhE n=2 Tax=Serpula lacrymans var. lacrymans TaxID=341189 RepID=F8QBA4_SERL3|nr:uncharacterized protein SERLADRAFT_418213 [Serpula lacrymans var. lacrymans S7.9]EGN94490.1 hypothetical protein SERLA73DRAFT_114730 [Serpula lacrymans var. lacrymans S7.3]EGO19969.1 hypothetical protein SERLADRAFT_418213 [Serpula lacrymans var. lacrymans S7.9]